jgi:hypothetical protein
MLGKYVFVGSAMFAKDITLIKMQTLTFEMLMLTKRQKNLESLKEAHIVVHIPCGIQCPK